MKTSSFTPLTRNRYFKNLNNMQIFFYEAQNHEVNYMTILLITYILYDFHMCNEGYGHEIHCKQIEFHVLGTSVDVNNKKIIDKKESFDFHRAYILF